MLALGLRFVLWLELVVMVRVSVRVRLGLGLVFGFFLPPYDGYLIIISFVFSIHIIKISSYFLKLYGLHIK